MRGGSPITRFRRVLSVACSAIGVPDTSILASQGGLSLPEAGLSVGIVISEGARVWRVQESYSVRSVGDENDREIATLLFEEPLANEWMAAKRLAMKIAEVRIDAAIDNAIA